MDLYIIVYLLSNIFLAHIINKFMYLFYEKCRVNKYIEFCIYSAYFILITVIFLILGNPISNLIFNILYILILTSLYDYINFRKSIIVTFVIYLILCCIELSVLAMINFNKSFGLYLSYKHKNIMVMVINSIICIIISFVIYLKKYSFKKIDLIISNKYFIFFIVVPIISIILLIINFLTSVNILGIIIVNLITLFLNIIILRYCDLTLKNIYKKIFSKVLNDRISNYKKEIQNFHYKSDFKSYINSNNYIVNEILNSKINDLDNEVRLRFDVLIGEKLNINLNDLLIIIGNLMDNAISGVNSTLKNKDKYLDIKIKYVKGTVIFNIKNSFNENTLDKRKRLFNKKGKFNNYGLGLLSVKEIVEKYKGIINIKFNRNHFETYILIYDIKV